VAAYATSTPARLFEDNSIRARGYLLLDAVLSHTRPHHQVGATVQNLLNAEWDEAQFATDSRLRGEITSANEINFTPGNPFYLKLNASMFF